MSDQLARGMRIAIVTVSLLALALSAWPAEASAPSPPQCSAADMQRGVLISGKYTRFCGTGQAVVRVAGKSFAFKGGWCTSTRSGFGVLHWTDDARRGRGFELVLGVVRRSGPDPIIDSEFQLPGVVLTKTPTGTAILAKSLKSATFTLVTAGSSGPMKITGSWTCKKIYPR